jgi:hypothetical protein
MAFAFKNYLLVPSGYSVGSYYLYRTSSDYAVSTSFVYDSTSVDPKDRYNSKSYYIYGNKYSIMPETLLSGVSTVTTNTGLVGIYQAGRLIVYDVLCSESVSNGIEGIVKGSLVQEPYDYGTGITKCFICSVGSDGKMSTSTDVFLNNGVTKSFRSDMDLDGYSGISCLDTGVYSCPSSVSIPTDICIYPRKQCYVRIAGAGSASAAVLSLSMSSSSSSYSISLSNGSGSSVLYYPYNPYSDSQTFMFLSGVISASSGSMPASVYLEVK